MALQCQNLTPPGARVSPAAPSRASDSPDPLELPTPSPAPPDQFHPPDNDVEEHELNIRSGYVKDEGDLASAMSAGMDFVFSKPMTKFLNACGATYVYATIKPTLAEKDKELDGQVAWLIYGKVSAEWQYLIEDAETAWDTWKALKESLLGPFQPSTRSPASSLGQNLLIWSQTGLYCSILSSYAIITVVAATSPSIVAITMSTTTPTTKHPFLALGEHNYRSWADDMEAYLKTLDLWDVTNDPTAALLPIDAANPTTEERKKVQDWEKHKGQASGQIWLAVEDGQKVHVKEVKSDPAKMWLKLREVHIQQKPGTHFNTYDALLGLRKLEGEPLASLMARADKAIQDIHQPIL
ncbi:hypothetical protein NEOLEDRAFT_1183766 [Neolentinus lepideus HHB14362 ss-1]|uniref:Uncharacterized protein n=1 Tax=Neolentinus lepideus HHB14362 ss-1 TaxID=1314782 RepID=A0A165N0B9_9AGAM|nr:hypothetical protein NEOLEDRAFT_1183766 [Neolentinus lepideus HHB14362 ss-1]